ncbi:acetoacetate decarboxylase family protein [Mechercharimyces sp. CAU 1602]|uniref:acetoacetate decarboxylase family protein n=1 Tax=Mechercharimyces sp. CAU 1602 TaxID=2973933 RepID=UPI002162CAF0|nr:acetoacetate decarboxylase family protein [Mechercharimyces sp. CAU 1602]MCS1350849.1 acetoacetate decarboxylase family protein [Mechercharimyces sp. CAU 1602]
MKPLLHYDESMLDNREKFDDDFFKRFELRHGEQPLQLDDHISKNYLFPTFYSDVTCAIGIFFCSYEKAERMMIDPRMKPIRMPKGRSLVIFSCYEYKNVLGIPPYNEIAMTIPVMVDAGWNPPVLPMVLEKLFPSFGYYVFSMPVTSLENRIRGHKIWGLPKEVQEITITNTANQCVTEAKEEDGTPYFQLSIPTEGKLTSFDVSSHLYSKLEGELLKSETHFKGNFHVQKNMKSLWQTGGKVENPILKIGDSPSGKVLQELEIEEVPFQTRYTKSMNSCFDLAKEKVGVKS